jgi:hypothetical protein
VNERPWSIATAGTAATAPRCRARTSRGRRQPRETFGTSCASRWAESVPHGTIGGHASMSSPIASISSADQRPVRASTSCVVLAIVASATFRPERR